MKCLDEVCLEKCRAVRKVDGWVWGWGSEYKSREQACVR